MVIVEKASGTCVYADLYSDGVYTWNFCQRADGSTCLYATRRSADVHFVVWDSVDGTAPNEGALEVMAELAAMRDAISTLLAKAGV